MLLVFFRVLAPALKLFHSASKSVTVKVSVDRQLIVDFVQAGFDLCYLSIQLSVHGFSLTRRVIALALRVKLHLLHTLIVLLL